MKKIYCAVILAALSCYFSVCVSAANLTDSVGMMVSPATNDRIGLIIAMLCVSGGALVIMISVSIYKKLRNKDK